MDHYMIRQELNPETCRLDGKLAGTSERRPFLISQIKASVFVSARALQWSLAPPALNLELERERTKEEKEREVLHLFRCYTHRPGRSRVNPERQEEEKSGHTTGRRPKTAQGGEGEQTDLRNQPTRRNGPDQKQRTHLNPTTHYGEARGEN